MMARSQIRPEESMRPKGEIEPGDAVQVVVAGAWAMAIVLGRHWNDVAGWC
jgi:hypothetical protein